MYESISLFIILPLSPVPLINEISIPFSDASFFANGEISTLPLESNFGWSWVIGSGSCLTSTLGSSLTSGSGSCLTSALGSALSSG